jgi:hypothetical protein
VDKLASRILAALVWYFWHLSKYRNEQVTINQLLTKRV